MDLILELSDKLDKLNISISELRNSGNALAEAERDYKILLRQEVLKLRDEGTAIGVIDKICYGIPSVAEARFKRDVAEAKYKANMEAINTFKLEIRIIQEQINKEYNSEQNF